MPRVAERAVQDEAGAQLGLGVRALVRERDGALHGSARQQRPGLDQDQLAGDRDERGDVRHAGLPRGSRRASR